MIEAVEKTVSETVRIDNEFKEQDFHRLHRQS